MIWKRSLCKKYNPSQGKQMLISRSRLTSAFLCAFSLGTALPILAQSAQQSGSSGKRRFEVASVKPCAPNAARGTLAGEVGKEAVRYNCQTLLEYIRTAYGGWMTGRFVGSMPVEKGAPWTNRDRYEITAKSGSPMNGTAVAEMMQSLLEDRFKLKVHKEAREVPAYALNTIKGGIRLPTAKTECYTMRLDEAPHPGPGQQLCGMGRANRDGIEVHGSTMADFCLSLSNMPFRLDRRVFVDKTGIKGRFDFNLRFPSQIPTESGAATTPPDDFTRLQDALRPVGLQLTFARGTEEVLVIDHAEPPQPN